MQIKSQKRGQKYQISQLATKPKRQKAKGKNKAW